jgi:hypothetical protein
MSKNKSLILVSLLYLALTLFLTFPLVLHLTTHIPGVSEDGPIHVWHLWWLKYSLFELHSNPIVTNYVFWPQTVNTIFDCHTFTNALISLPLQPIFGLVLTSNLIIIASLTLSAIGAYLLAKYVLRDGLVAFISGIIFAYSPYIFAHLLDGHTNLITTWPIPFYVWFLLRTLKNLRWKDAMLAGIFLGALSMNDYTYIAFSLIFTGLIFLYRFLTNWCQLINFKTISRLGLLFVVWFLIFSPLAVPALKSYFAGFGPGAPLATQNFYGADILWFLKSSPLHPLLGRLASVPKLGMVESTVTLGWSVIFLVLVGTFLIISSRKGSDPRVGSDPRQWVFLAAAIFLLTLGPSLHFNGQSEWYFGDFRLMIPLPFILVHLLPFIGGTQEPARMTGVLMLPLAMLAAFGLQGLTVRFGRFGKILAVEIASAIIVFEFLAIPFPLNDMKVPEVYYEIAKDKGDFAVMSLPLGWNNNDEALGQTVLGNLQYYQVVHQHPILRGTVARLPHENFEFYRQQPGMEFLIYPSSCGYQMKEEEVQAVRQTLKDFKVKYIVVFPDLFPSGSRPDLSCFAWLTGYEKFYQDLETVAFRWTSQ